MQCHNVSLYGVKTYIITVVCTLPLRFGDNLVLVASQELREKSLTPPDQDSPLYLLADIQYAILEVVGASRHHGLPRPFLTTDYLKIDVRSVFHHVKTLRLSGYLTVKVQQHL